MNYNPEFSADFVSKVKSGIERSGHCMVGRGELEDLWNSSKNCAANLRELLELVASACEAEVETGITLRWARFVPRGIGGAPTRLQPMEEMMRRMA